VDKATISQLKNRLSAYLDRVRGGLIRRARAKLDLKALRRPAPRAHRSVREALIEERRQGR
jgi:antitoxin (DNA-binding transcriptional repressor) of toxin-antitoxin stability system